MTTSSAILNALGIEHIRLAYHYTDAGDLDGHASLLTPGAEIDVPGLVPGRTQHELRTFLVDGSRVVVLGTVRTANPGGPVEFADVFTLSPHALIMCQRRYQYTTEEEETDQ
jgi:hypothetical protein